MSEIEIQPQKIDGLRNILGKFAGSIRRGLTWYGHIGDGGRPSDWKTDEQRERDSKT
jgi:hypothetical protein